MSKRTKLILLIITVVLLFGIGLYFFLQPILENRVVEQPPQLPDATTPVLPKSRPRPAPGQVASTTIPQVTLDDSAKLRMLETKAATVTERVFSGSNSDGFSGYEDVAADFSSSGQQWLYAEKQRMQAAHPMSGPAFGITARAVSSKLMTGAAWGNDSIQVTVQLILREDIGTQSAKKIIWNFEKQSDGSYLISSASVSDLSL